VQRTFSGVHAAAAKKSYLTLARSLDLCKCSLDRTAVLS
jgi:hypothetical protein